MPIISRAKTNDFASVLRCRNTLGRSIRDYFESLHGFVNVQTPILTSIDCEGAGEAFEVEPPDLDLDPRPEDEDQDSSYFGGKKVALTVSGQLHLEAVCNGLGKVYNFSPVFRAEKSGGRRHLSEFTMIEAEEAFQTEMKDLLRRIQTLLQYSVQNLVQKNSQDLSNYAKLRKTGYGALTALDRLVNSEFEVMTYAKAMEVLTRNNDTFQTAAKFGSSLGKEHERYLSEVYCNGNPVFVVEWPKKAKPFYCKQSAANFDLVDAVDLIVPEVGELVGGSLRESDPDILLENMNRQGLDMEVMRWYLDLRKCGAAPTAGFGLGFDRLVQFAVGIRNIKDALPFPRTAKLCSL